MLQAVAGTRTRIAVVLALLLPSLALADARLEARKRFKIGMSLIADGRYEEGIDQLLEAYSIKPHPNVLYNVARAYEAMSRPADALQYYRRYLDSEPPDAQQVVATINKLEALVPKKEEERPKEREKEPPPREIVTKETKVVDEAVVARLNALADRLERAAQKAEDAAKDAEAAKAEAAKAGDKADLPAGAVPEEELTEVPYEETVVTASRRAQSTLEAPNATTVISADEIRMSGATTLPELLRRVPGCEVMAMGVSSYNVSFRGFNQRVANKVLVLVDGRTEYQDFLGLTMWPAIPIGLEEIERIEIIRGPGSALYGANAMLGVINIITRPPGTGKPAELNGYAGNGNQAGGSFIASGGEKLKYRASVGYAQANKYSRDYADERIDVASQSSDPDLGLRSARANLVTHYSFTKDISVSVAGGVNRLQTEFYALGILRNYYIDGTGGYMKADASLGPVKIRFFWNHLDANAGPQYAPIGTRSLSTQLESNVFDGEATFQKEFKLAGIHRLGVGLSVRGKRLSWTYIGRLKQELHAGAFIQDEWRIVDPVSIVASYRIDRHPLLDNGSPGYAQSPRISAVWTPAEGQALHASFSTAFREPTFLESYMDLRTPLPGVNGGSVLTQGNTSLKPEQLLSFELGWRGELAKLGLEYDLAGYYNVVSNLITLSAVQPLPAGELYDSRSSSFLLGRSLFINDPQTYTAVGGELGATWSVLSGLDVRASASLQSVSASDKTGPCGPCTQAPAFKLYAGAQYRTPVGLDLGVDVAYTSSTVWVEREPDTADPTKISNTSYPLADYTVLNARVAYRLFKDRVTIGVVGTQLAAQHAEHPFGNQIDRRVFATLKVVP